MDTFMPAPRSWHYWLLTAVLITAFGWFALCTSIKCRCHESVWHEAQARAGLIFVGVVFLRMIAAAIIRDRHFVCLAYLIMSLLSPLWIRLVFDLLLRIRDAYSA